MTVGNNQGEYYHIYIFNISVMKNVLSIFLSLAEYRGFFALKNHASCKIKNQLFQ